MTFVRYSGYIMQNIKRRLIEDDAYENPSKKYKLCEVNRTNGACSFSPPCGRETSSFSFINSNSVNPFCVETSVVNKDVFQHQGVLNG